MSSKFDWTSLSRVPWRLAVLLAALACPGTATAQEKSAFQPVDLSAFYHETFTNLPVARPWNQIPRGAQNLGGVPFNIGGKLEVTGMDAARHGVFRNARVAGIPAGSKAARLHLLHGAAHGLKDGVPMASLVLHYAGGETRSLRLAYGVHARNWIRPAGEFHARPEDPNSSIVWSITEETDSFDGTLRFYKTAFDNPLPDREIVSLDVVSLFSKATPIIFALTLERGPVPPLRASGSSKAERKAGEFDDSVYSREIFLQVTEADATTPVTNAVTQLLVIDDQSSFFFGETAADSRGVMLIRYPPQQALELRMLVKAPGHAPAVLNFSGREPKGYPKRLKLAMAPGTKAGGTVLSEAGRPLEQTEVLIFRETRAGANDIARILFDSVITDSAGRWASDRLPAKLDGLSFQLVNPGFKSVTYEAVPAGGSNSLPVEPAALLAGQAVMTMQTRLYLTGVVTDSRGEVLRGAEVALYTEDNGRKRYKSDAQGKFSIIMPSSGRGAITVSATNFSPVYQALDFDLGVKPLKFTLNKGLPFKARIHDQDGRPVVGARVELDSWNNTRLLSWQTQTDAEGRFAWANAPLGGLQFSVTKTEHYSARFMTGIPTNGEAVVTMRRYARASGTVLDATTREPVPLFSVHKAHRFFPEEPLRWNRGWSDKYRRGSYSVPFGEYTGGETRLLFEAPGYLPVLSPPITRAGYHTNDILLQPGRGLEGIVLSPDGSPATNAAVLLVDPVADVFMDYSTSFRRLYSSGESATTGRDGRFELAPRFEARTVLATHLTGFARTDVRTLASTGKIVLQPWGRVRGNIRVGDKPPGSQPVMLHNLDHDYGETGRTNLGLELRAWTDARGNFSFDRVPPGEWKVSLQYRLREISGAPPSLSHGLPVLVKSGETTEVSLGGSGAGLTGLVQPSGLDPSGIDWLRDAHRLVLVTPGADDPPPDFSRARNESEQRKLALEHAARQRAYWTSDKGRTAARAHRTYALVFDTNGVFHAANIPPGTYQLTIAPTFPLYGRYTNSPLGQISRRVVVRDSDVGGLLDLGVLKLEPKASSRLGQPAPAFVAKTFEGRAVKSEDFRGKFLLLDLWTTWTEARTGDVEILKSLAASDTNRLAVLSVNLDQDPRTAAAWLAQNAAAWPQTWFAPWSDSKLPAAFGADAPGIILLDPAGKITSKPLRGLAIRTAVTNALADPKP